MKKKQTAAITILFLFTILVCTQTSTAGSYQSQIVSKSSNTTCDIIITKITAPTMVFKGKTIKISSTIKNRGNMKCTGFYADYFLKSCKNGQNIYIGSVYINGLGPGQSKTQNLTFNLPKNITCNNYYARILADSSNNLNETNKTNNVGYSLERTSVVTGRPVYITSDNIKNVNKDNARIDEIVKGLNAKGLYAVNYGLGPNKHYSVLKNVVVPENAIIVNIYGGACAGTIWEMTQKYYKKALGTRKVFSVWINTKVDIYTVNFLKRSSDDNYTPKYGEKGGFPQFLDTNKNGIFEPELGEKDGIVNPGELLKKNGYNFIYQQDGNIDKIVNAIFHEATS